MKPELELGMDLIGTSSVYDPDVVVPDLAIRRAPYDLVGLLHNFIVPPFTLTDFTNWRHELFGFPAGMPES